jgi:hypothetical protein
VVAKAFTSRFLAAIMTGSIASVKGFPSFGIYNASKALSAPSRGPGRWI